MARSLSPACPPPEILGAFVEGKLDVPTRTAVKAHIASCSQCVFVVGETNRYLQIDESDAAVEVDEPRREQRWHSAVAAAIAVVCAVAIVRVAEKRRDPLGELRRAAATAASRPVEGQLAQFAYSPYRSPRSDVSQRNLVLRLKAERLVEIRAHDARAWHARGIATLFMGNHQGAIAMLGKAIVLSPREADYWSDLAAAHLAAGANGDISEVRNALSAAARATALDPTLAAAEFNRAIALELLDDPTAAAAAYDRCLQLDPTSSWTGEVRMRRARLTR
jgi:tetratricopeptide (TPR) repeat protein